MSKSCTCSICITERKVSEALSGLDATHQRAVLAKLAGDSLGKIERGVKRTKAAANFIRFMQERAEINDSKSDLPPEVESAVSELVSALRQAGFNVADAQIIKV